MFLAPVARERSTDAGGHRRLRGTWDQSGIRASQRSGAARPGASAAMWPASLVATQEASSSCPTMALKRPGDRVAASLMVACTPRIHASSRAAVSVPIHANSRVAMVTCGSIEAPYKWQLGIPRSRARSSSALATAWPASLVAARAASLPAQDGNTHLKPE